MLHAEYIMKTYDQLQTENAELKRMLENKKKTKKNPKSEWHHRAFEKICPMPDLDALKIERK